MSLFGSSSLLPLASSGPQRLLQGRWFQKLGHVGGEVGVEGGWGGALKDYVVLILLSSCLMAERVREDMRT